MAAAQWQLASLLALIWTCTILYGEWLQYLAHSPICRDLLPERSPPKRMDRKAMVDHYTVAIISSPRLLTSAGRAFLAYKVRDDILLHRRFRSSVIHRAHPNLVVILGDLFSGGLGVPKEEFDSSLRRYKHIFSTTVRAHTSRRMKLRGVRHPRARIRQIPGPRDVSATLPNGTLVVKDELFDKFTDEFKLELNFVEPADDVLNVVGINSVAADGNVSSHFTSTFWSFIDQKRQSGGQSGDNAPPSVVVSPIPIFVPPGAQCFSVRRPQYSAPVLVHPGMELSRNSTARVVAALRPAFFVSGSHEGETCWLASQAPSSSSTGAAVGSSKDAAKGLRGGQMMLGSFHSADRFASAPFLLLSVAPKYLRKPAAGRNASDSLLPLEDLRAQLCFTPSQYGILIWYYLLAVITVASFLLLPPRSAPLEEGLRAVNHFRGQFKKAKLKVDDSGIPAYVEVVDAEGNMYLAPKYVADDAPDNSSVFAGAPDRREDGPQHRGKHPGGGKSAPKEGSGSRVGPGAAPHAPHALLPLSLSALRGRIVSAAGPIAALIGCEFALYMGLMANDWA